MSISKNQPMRQAEIDLINAFNDANLDNLPEVVEDVTALETVVGNANSGLVKDVSDLQTSVGNNSYGLVKDVNDLKTTVGNDNSGLVKDVTEISTDLSILTNTVGDNTSGLVKDVDTLETEIGELNSTISEIECGSIIFPEVSAGSSNVLEITFDHIFSSTPIISLTRLGSGNVSYDEELTVSNRNPSKFTIKVFNNGSSAITPTIGWIATTIGKHI